MVVVSGGSAILRQRIEMAGESKPPYHDAEPMDLTEAQAWIQRTARASVEMATAAIKEAVRILGGEGYRVETAAVLLGSGKPLPKLSTILGAHPLIHTAEGIFFRDVLRSACEGCGLQVTGVKEREALQQCSTTLGSSVEDLMRSSPQWEKWVPHGRRTKSYLPRPLWR